jgi:hypothetical protein
MLNIYYYTYFKLYKFVEKTNRDVAEWASMIFFSELLWFNIFTILYYLDLLQSDFIKHHAYVSVLVMVLLFIINYFVFINNRRYRKIIKLYSSESKNKNVIGIVLVIIYSIVSIYLFFHTLHVF